MSPSQDKPAIFVPRDMLSPDTVDSQSTVEPQRAAEPQGLAAVDAGVPIALSEMDGVKLMDRVDTKYLVTDARLEALLTALSASHRVMQIEGERAHGYDNVYFDTADLAMYRAHHDGARSRFKVRKRTYVGSEISFLELKEKSNQNRTKKKRRRTEGDAHGFDTDDAEWLSLRGPYAIPTLVPRLEIRFRRLTFVDYGLTERVTLDLGLSFRLPGAACWYQVPHELAVVEVKKSRGCGVSPAQSLLRRYGIHPASFSKYGVGTALLNPSLKRNHFKPALRRVAHLHPIS